MVASTLDKIGIKIYAIGGGGLADANTVPNKDVMLEDRLLALAPEMPKIGYIGHASNDNPDRVKAFYARFSDCAKASHLPIDASAAAAQDFLAGLDIIYVGGGSTKQMLRHWRITGFDNAFSEAGRRGVILAGVSAGAICWFSDLLLGTANSGFELLPGLGLIAGSVCPHYDSEPKRRDAYDNAIAKGRLAPGLAIDDGVAVYIVSGRVCEIIKTRHGHAAFVKAGQGGAAVREGLRPGFFLGNGASAQATFEMSNGAH